MIKKWINDNSIFVFILCIFTALNIIYLMNSTSNVPMMDYWKYITFLVENMYKSGISFNELYYYGGNNNIHHVPFQLLFFLINTKYFHLNTRIEIFGGLVFIILISICLYIEFKKMFYNKIDSQIFLIAELTIVSICFSLAAFEILTLEFSFGFGFRMLLFIVSFLWVNNFLTNTSVYYNNTLKLAGLLFVIITCVAGGYFLAYGFSMTLVIIFDFYKKSSEDKKRFFINYCILGLSMIIAFLVYMYNIKIPLDTNEVDGNNSGAALLDLIKSIVVALGAALCGPDHSTNYIYIIGFVFLIFQFMCFFIYFKQKQYAMSYIPMLLMLYVFSLIVELYLGRGTGFGVDYMMSSRYCYDTKLIAIADIWILMRYNGKCISGNIKKITINTAVILIFVVTMHTNYIEYKIGPARKLYFNDLIKKMYEIETLDDEELQNFQDSPDAVRDGVEIMKKYKLGVFYYDK